MRVKESLGCTRYLSRIPKPSNRLLTIMCGFGLVFTASAALRAETGAMQCALDDRLCLHHYVRDIAKTIDRPAWRDQTLREVAKSYAADGQIATAITVIDDIENPDTKAMTIRGIGMEVADLPLNTEQKRKVFAKLTQESQKIDHPPSFAIALTYVAMAQAFAKDNEGAWETAASMENAALRNKAYGETAEIQAEHGDLDAAMKSIGFIGTTSYRNKTYNLVSKILADQGLFQEALQAADGNTNMYKKASSIQYILNKERDALRDAKQ